MIRTIFLALLITSCVLGQQAVFAQTGISLEAEIQSLEKTLNKPEILNEQRHDTLVRLARLRQLSGDIEGAARNWLEAAAAVPGRVDDNALLSCAVCLAAMGEWDRACTALDPLVNKLKRARFLDTGIKAIKSGDTSALAALAENPQFLQMKSEIYFMLWKVSRGQTAENWREKLIAEYPHSPEGRLAAGEQSSAISVRPSPFWFFASGLDSLPLSAETYKAAVTQETPKPANTAAPQTSAPKPGSVSQAGAPAQTTSLAKGAKLQTGKYGEQVNADKQMDKLRSAGFTPFTEKRDDYWFVLVPSGTDQKQTIKALKEAGFDSFPVK